MFLFQIYDHPSQCAQRIERWPGGGSVWVRFQSRAWTWVAGSLIGPQWVLALVSVFLLHRNVNGLLLQAQCLSGPGFPPVGNEGLGLQAQDGLF